MKLNAFSLCGHIGHPLEPEPLTHGLWISQMAEGLMDIILRHLVFFSNVNGGSEEDLIHFLSMAILATPSGPNTWPRDRFTVYIKGWMASITLLLVFSKMYMGSEKKIFFKIWYIVNIWPAFVFRPFQVLRGDKLVTTRSQKR